MKNIMTKRVIIIFSVLLAVVVTALILALVTGNSRIPQLSNPEGVFYERVDENGDVIYTITNQEIFEELKSNDGVEQLLYLIDSYLLQSYMSQVTNTQIEEMITRLTYGTSDADEIADLTDDQKESYETAFAQSMVLAGYSGNEEAYARIRVAKEVYTRFMADNEDLITEEKIASEFMKKYFEDIKAIRIRFASAADAVSIMQKYQLVTLSSTSTIRQYNGFVYKNETLHPFDDEDAIVEAYVTVEVFYTDAEGNLVNLADEEIYTKSTGAIYTDEDGNEYTKDESLNLINEDSEIVVEAAHIFTTKELANAYYEANTHYYTVSKIDAYDTDERAQVLDGVTVLYTIDKDGKIYDPLNVDVTSTTVLIVNKVYKPIKTMGTVTVNNSAELTNDEVLAFYIKMYNDIYSEFRTPLVEGSTSETLINSANPDLDFVFDTVNASSTSLASYMFSTLDLSKDDAIPYTAAATSYTVSNNTYHYMVYKLTQPDKVNIYELMLDAIEDTIVLPMEAAKDITLPTTGWFNSTISWTSANTAILSAKGVVTTPENDTNVKLTYKITLDGVTRSGDIIVKVLKEGENSTVTPSSATKPVVKTLMADDVTYDALYNKLLDEYVLSTSTDNVSNAMIELRKDYSLAINDKFIGVDYTAIDKDFEYNKKGDKVILATINGFPGYLGAAQTDTAYEVSADDLFEFAIGKSASLYTLYASQFKEIVYSDYFVTIFGEQRDLTKNKSDKMDEIYESIRSQKMTYLSYKAMYEQYGISFDYEDFASFSRYQYGTKSEMDLLKYLVKGVLQPYMIGEAIEAEDLIAMLLETVEENYDNYFSLDISHLIIHIDFDEDGAPDNYNDYIASLDATELDAFDTLKASLETEILTYLDDSENDFSDLITAYKNDSRDVDSTWGKYKNAGLWLMTESLNIADEEDETITHSLQYSGQYGVKDSYVPEYTEALIALYQEYQLEQNANLEQLYSDLVTTQFGVHLILANQGDDFERFSAEYTGPASSYSEGVVNTSGKPTLAQLELYAQYYMYSLIYDLEDTEIEEKYNITVPTFPNSVREALEFYFEDLLSGLYVVGTLNIQLSTRLSNGNFLESSYTDLTEAQLMAQLDQIRDTYYDALFAKYAK
ncbi:MAG: hypothetical protein CVV56_05655 [Tenericutes bacterium HGW-Tenericutes-1]|nr:MAG: hypothetical protein CVV56_05655 [Tenericutes bacterium HGW-Tenericutes-1]